MAKTPMSKIFSMGMISVWIFLLGIGAFVLVKLDVAEKWKLPEYQGESGWGPAFELLGAIFFVCLPLLISSLVVGIVSVVMGKGRTAGIIAIVSIGIVIMGLPIFGRLI